MGLQKSLPHFIVGVGAHQLLNRGLRRLVKHAVRLRAARKAFDASAGRVGSFGVDARQFQCLAVGRQHVAGVMHDHNRMLCGDIIQVVAIRMTHILKASVVVAAPSYPLP